MEGGLASGGRYLAFRELLRHTRHSTESLDQLASCCIREFATDGFVESVENAPILEERARDSCDDEYGENTAYPRNNTDNADRNKQFRLLFMCAVGMWSPESEHVFLRHFFQQQNSNDDKKTASSVHNVNRPSNKTLKDCFRNLLSIGKGQTSVIRGIAVLVLLKLVMVPSDSDSDIYLNGQRQEKIRRLLLGESKACNLLRLLMECLDIVSVLPVSCKRTLDEDKLGRVSDKPVRQTLQGLVQGRTIAVSVEQQFAIFHHEMCNLIVASFSLIFQGNIADLSCKFFDKSVLSVARNNCSGWAASLVSNPQSCHSRKIESTMEILRKVSSASNEWKGDIQCIRAILSILDERLHRASSNTVATLLVKSLWFLLDKALLRWDGSPRMSLAYLVFANLTDLVNGKESELQSSSSCMSVLPKIVQQLTSQLDTSRCVTSTGNVETTSYPIAPWRLLLNAVRLSEAATVNSQHFINGVYRLSYKQFQFVCDTLDKELSGTYNEKALANLGYQICDTGTKQSESVNMLRAQIPSGGIAAILLLTAGTLGQQRPQDIQDVLLLTASALSVESYREQMHISDAAYKNLFKEMEQGWRDLSALSNSSDVLPFSARLSSLIRLAPTQKSVCSLHGCSDADPYEAAIVLMEAYEDSQRELTSVREKMSSLTDNYQRQLEELEAQLRNARNERETFQNEISRLYEEKSSNYEAYQQMKKDRDYFERCWEQLQRHEQQEREQQDDDIARLRSELQQAQQDNDGLRKQLRQKMKLEKEIKRLLSGNDTSTCRQDATEVLSQWIEASQNTTGVSHGNEDHFTMNDEEIENALTNSEEEANAALESQSNLQEGGNVVNDLSRRFSYISPVTNRGSVSQNYLGCGSKADLSGDEQVATQRTQHNNAPGYEDDRGQEISSDVLRTQSRRAHKRPTRTPKSALRKQLTPTTKRVTISSPVSRRQHSSQQTVNQQNHKQGSNNNSTLWQAFEDLPVEEAVHAASRQDQKQHVDDGTTVTGNKFVYSPSPVRTPKTRRVSSSAKKKPQRPGSRSKNRDDDNGQHYHHYYSNEDDWLLHEQQHHQEHHRRGGGAEEEDKENMLDALVTDITASTFHGYE
eukprot:gb/GECG01005847.1/.p1 GENE.gb/GECG01005847.1/~~gb/GECG01005847.1/.p1  ORF type:complete len:1098 (+),score=169.04 gb/GECG01005847.1/:1-3294(+)